MARKLLRVKLAEGLFLERNDAHGYLLDVEPCGDFSAPIVLPTHQDAWIDWARRTLGPEAERRDTWAERKTRS